MRRVITILALTLLLAVTLGFSFDWPAIKIPEPSIVYDINGTLCGDCRTKPNKHIFRGDTVQLYCRSYSHRG